ncbi:MAG TPA: hypothetical protein VGL45_12430, partial [Bradyrhizobium sp.]
VSRFLSTWFIPNHVYQVGLAHKTRYLQVFLHSVFAGFDPVPQMSSRFARSAARQGYPPSSYGQRSPRAAD